jgi:hypothetical protein
MPCYNCKSSVKETQIEALKKVIQELEIKTKALEEELKVIKNKKPAQDSKAPLIFND